jgi:hypothetical protein
MNESMHRCRHNGHLANNVSLIYSGLYPGIYTDEAFFTIRFTAGYGPAHADRYA